MQTIISSGQSAQALPELALDDETDEAVDLEASHSPQAAHLTVLREFTTGHDHHGQRLDRVMAQLLPDSS